MDEREEQGGAQYGTDPDPAKWPQKMPEDNASYGAGPESLESLRFRDYLMFIGFLVHSFYWNREDEPSTNCFSRVVEFLYKGQSALS